MKYVLSVAAVVLMIAGAAKADGNISRDVLAKMGLGGLQVMSDSQGMAVRGLGYYSSKKQNVVYGSSYASAKWSGYSSCYWCKKAASGKAKAGGSYYAAGNNYATGSSTSLAAVGWSGAIAINHTSSTAY